MQNSYHFAHPLYSKSEIPFRNFKGDFFPMGALLVLWTSTRLGLFRVDYQGLQPEWVVTRNFNRVK
jgi:hypothetical protein